MAVPLVTNGDGNHAAGLAVLVSALHDLGVVHVLAPETRRRRSTARRRIASTSACSACCPDRHVESRGAGVNAGVLLTHLRRFGIDPPLAGCRWRRRPGAP